MFCLVVREKNQIILASPFTYKKVLDKVDKRIPLLICNLIDFFCNGLMLPVKKEQRGGDS